MTTLEIKDLHVSVDNPNAAEGAQAPVVSTTAVGAQAPAA
jgi:hypothetical protein